MLTRNPKITIFTEINIKVWKTNWSKNYVHTNFTNIRQKSYNSHMLLLTGITFISFNYISFLLQSIYATKD
jgi:hypothetical protein